MRTSELIESLSRQAAPIERLPPPQRGAGAWLVAGAAIIALLGLVHGVRPDIAEKLVQPSFLVQWTSAVLTAVTAAVAAFLVSLPDRSPLWSALPLPSAAVWIASIGYGCVTNWVPLGSSDAVLIESLRCLITVALTSVPLAFLLLVMLHHAVSIRPILTVVIGALAVSALAASALSLLHAIDATIMVLAWNVGTVVLLVGAASLGGGRLFNLVRPIRHP